MLFAVQIHIVRVGDFHTFLCMFGDLRSDWDQIEIRLRSKLIWLFMFKIWWELKKSARQGVNSIVTRSEPTMMTAFSLVELSWFPFTKSELEMNRKKTFSRASLMVTDGERWTANENKICVIFLFNKHRGVISRWEFNLFRFQFVTSQVEQKKLIKFGRCDWQVWSSNFDEQE